MHVDQLKCIVIMCPKTYVLAKHVKIENIIVWPFEIILHKCKRDACTHREGGGPMVVVSTAAFHARFRGSVPDLGGLKETKNVSSKSMCESQYCGEPP